MSHAHLALLEWALEIDIADLVTEVCRLVDQGDQAVFDGESNVGTLFDVLAEKAGGDYGEVGVAAEKEG